MSDPGNVVAAIALLYELCLTPVTFAEHALARERLTDRNLADVDVDRLSADELATLDALLGKLIDGTTGDVDLRVVAEAKPFMSSVVACAS